MNRKWVEGLYEYSGLGSHIAILHICGRWYLAGWEIPLVFGDTSDCQTVREDSIGKLLYEIRRED